MSTISERFLGRSGSVYCGAACRKHAQRARGADKRDNRDAARVTDSPSPTAPAGGSKTGHGGDQFGHSAEALALLASLDLELSANSAEHGLIDPLEWTAAEQAVREAIASTDDRQCDLRARYHASDDDKTRVKLSGELRLLESSLSRLLKSVNTDLPAQPSNRSQKASRAAYKRWRHAAD